MKRRSVFFRYRVLHQLLLIAITSLIFCSPAFASEIGLTQSTYSVLESDGNIDISVVRTASIGEFLRNASVKYTITGKSATAGSDFQAVLVGTLSWASKESGIKKIPVSIINDFITEGNETFTVNLSNCSEGVIDILHCKLSRSFAEVTIVDSGNPGMVEFNPANYSVNEADGTVSLTLSRTGGSDGSVSVSFNTVDGSAAAGQDFNGKSGTVTWADGDSADKTISIGILDDTFLETAETFSVELISPSSGLKIGNNGIAGVTIVDNESPGTVEFTSTTYSVNEADGAVSLTLTRKGGSAGTVSVIYRSVNGAAIDGQDYSSQNGTITWGDGDNADKTISISIIDDQLIESPENFTVTISSLKAVNQSTQVTQIGANSSAEVTIIDNDNLGTIGFSPVNYSVNEVDGRVSLSLSRSGGSDGIVTVNYSTVDGSATAGQDYTKQNGSVTWQDGDIADKTISIGIINDDLFESAETLTVVLSSQFPQLTLGSNATVTINNTLKPGEVQFDQTVYSGIEGDLISIKVLRVKGKDGELNVGYTIKGITATVGSDFTGPDGLTGNLSWTDQDLAEKIIKIQLNKDFDFNEEKETIAITLSAVNGVSQNATLTIIDSGDSGLADTPGLTPNQRSVARALDGACPAGIIASGEFGKRCRELLAFDDNDRHIALSQITPDSIAAQGTNSIEVGAYQLTNLRERLVALRAGARGVSVNKFTVNMQGEAIPVGQFTQHFLNNSVGVGGGGASADALADQRLGFFIQGKLNFGDRQSTINETGFDFDTKGITFGSDYRFTDEFIMGLALGYANVNNNFASSAGKMEQNTGFLAIYGSYYLPKDFYFDLIANAGINDFDVKRNINYRGINTSLTSNPDGRQYGVSLNFGKNVFIQSWLINPYARFEYIGIEVDGYQEKGNSGLALVIDKQSLTSITTTLGGQISKSISMPWGVLLPGAHFEWEHQFNNDQRLINAGFVDAMPGTGSFSIVTDNPDRNYFNIGASLSASFAHGRSVFIRYESRVDQQFITRHSVELDVRIPF